MSQEPSIIVRRGAADRLQVARLQIEASSGVYRGGVEIWCPATKVDDLGRELMGFPSKVPDKYEFYVEESEITQNFRLSVETVDGAGHVALEIALSTSAATCWLSFRAEAAALNRLGGLFSRLSHKATGAFRWTPSEDEVLGDLGW